MQIQKFGLKKHVLDFKFEAGTSRGVLKQHTVYYLTLTSGTLSGVGEIAPLPKLSIDYGADFEPILNQIDWSFCENANDQDQILDAVVRLGLHQYPALVFGLETALLELYHGGTKKILACDFYQTNQGIPINGLVWMNTKAHMMQQVKEKLEAGYRCIKLKIGALQWKEELEILEHLRDTFSANELVLRVDANGAFEYHQAKDVLRELERLDVHSIEQPIAVGQECFMKTLAKYNRVGVALDEELIGVYGLSAKQRLLEEFEPNYIILKPTLLGGLKSCMEWIELAQMLGIDWWLTSALESNIGLNAISQFASYLQAENYQGLGTGQLYHNNITSPLTIKQGYLYYDQEVSWGTL